MEKLIVAIILVGALGTGIKLRITASSARKEVMERLSNTNEMDPTFSPTAQLFREHGLPPVESAENIGPIRSQSSPLGAKEYALRPEDSRPTGPPPMTESGPGPAGEKQPTDEPLQRLVEGMRLPAGLSFLGSVDASSAVFATPAHPTVVVAALSDEFARVGSEVQWKEPGHGYITRNGVRSSLEIVEYKESDEPAPEGEAYVTQLTIRTA